MTLCTERWTLTDYRRTDGVRKLLVVFTLLASACIPLSFQLRDIAANPEPLPGLRNSRLLLVLSEPAVREDYRTKADHFDLELKGAREVLATSTCT